MPYDHQEAECKDVSLRPTDVSPAPLTSPMKDSSPSAMTSVKDDDWSPEQTIAHNGQESRAVINPEQPVADNGQESRAIAVSERQPGDERDVTLHRERAMLYLERKRLRQERTSGAITRPGSSETNERTDTDERRALDASRSSRDKQPTLASSTAEGIDEASRALKKVDAPRQLLIVPSQAPVQPYRAKRRPYRRKLLVRHLVRKHMRRERTQRRRAFNRLWTIVTCVVASIAVITLSTAGAATYASYRFYLDTQNKFNTQVVLLSDLLPKDNLKMFDSKGIPIGQLTDQGIHTSVALNDVSTYLVNATVATEDKNFWTNPGVDIPRIIQAALDDLQHGRVVEGGSTITQQLIKTLIVGGDTTIVRKLQEVVLTPQLNSRYTKQDIMSMYLNSIYYGEQAYGIDAAANVYFGLEDQPGEPASKQLDIAQAAMLAGIPNSPDAYDPLKHPQVASGRFQEVLNAMIREHYITRSQAFEAIQEEQNPSFFKQALSLTSASFNRAPHFFNFVLTQLEQIYHRSRAQLSRSDMRVTTTLDIGLQDHIQKIMQGHIAALRDSNHITNAAEVLIDYHTGAIRSLLGSIDYNNKSIDGQFDVATQGYRQPGSSFKPYVYVTAFEQGASPAQAIADEPLTINLPDSYPSTFTPSNYDNNYHGHMTLRCALQNSLNIPAVKVLQHAGINAAMKTAQDMGITSYSGTPGYSLVLGGLGVRLLDHTSAMGTFADNGVHVPYYDIDKVVFPSTHITYGHPYTPGKQVVSPQLAYMMTSVLSDNASRIPEFFDCNVLQLYANSQNACYAGNRGAVRPAAAKTGTTNDFRDNWTIGYTTDYVMGVWAGNDDNTPMYNVTGVQGAAPIWHDSMLVAEQGHPIHDFANPGGLERSTVTYADGVHTTDWFMPGTEPFPAAASQNTDNNGFSLPSGDQNNPVLPPAVTTRAYCPSSYNFASTPPRLQAQRFTAGSSTSQSSSLDAGWW